MPSPSVGSCTMLVPSMARNRTRKEAPRRTLMRRRCHGGPEVKLVERPSALRAGALSMDGVTVAPSGGLRAPAVAPASRRLGARGFRAPGPRAPGRRGLGFRSGCGVGAGGPRVVVHHVRSAVGPVSSPARRAPGSVALAAAGAVALGWRLAPIGRDVRLGRARIRGSARLYGAAEAAPAAGPVGRHRRMPQDRADGRGAQAGDPLRRRRALLGRLVIGPTHPPVTD